MYGDLGAQRLEAVRGNPNDSRLAPLSREMLTALKKLPWPWKTKLDAEFAAPSFVFAASWRTGSTLLQRIINASGEIFIWGEPTMLPEARALFQRTEERLEKVKGNRGVAIKNAVGSWIPVVSPAPERAKEASRAFFEALYLQDTRQFGVSRWGFKEVREDAVAHMHFLSALWPEARFIFLTRDPYDTYRSVRGKKFHANFDFPLQPIHMWTRNVSEYLDDRTLNDRCLLVSYEELSRQTRQDDGLLKKIAQHFEIPITDRMYQELEARTDPSGCDITLSDDELAQIALIVGDVAERLAVETRK